MKLDILIAVEDPGAANFVLELPSALTSNGLHCTIVAIGPARAFLRDRGIDFVELAAESRSSELVETLRPQLLLAGTSQNPDSPILAHIDEAKLLGIPAVGFVDMAADANLRFNGLSDNPLKHAPDWLLVADRFTEQAFLDLGFPAERLLCCGHPAYDRVLQRATELVGTDRAAIRRALLGHDPAPRPVWLFAAEHGDGDPRLSRGQGYTLHGRGSSDRRVDIVLEEVLEARTRMLPKPFLILRLHPKNTPEEFACYVPEIDMVSHGGDPLNLIWLADIVLGLSSTLLMEAALMGLPTVSVTPRSEERDWSPSVMAGLTSHVSTRDDLFRVLASPVPTVFPGIRTDVVDCIRKFVLRRIS